MIALRVGDIHIARSVASITKSRHIGEENAPKTAGSARTVKLFPHVAKLLDGMKKLRVTEADYFFINKEGGPIDPDQWRKDYWYKALRALKIRERKFYNTRHTFISLALTAGENPKAIAEHCGTSIIMAGKNYGRYMRADFGERFMELSKGKTEISGEISVLKRASGGNQWRPRRDLNPCYRRERPVSWAELDDGDVLVSRAGFEPATLCLKGRCSTA